MQIRQVSLDFSRLNNVLAPHHKFIKIMCNLKQEKSQVKKKNQLNLTRFKKKKKPEVEAHPKRCEHVNTGQGSALCSFNPIISFL